MTPAVLFVIGASGAGKTAAVEALRARQLAGVQCYFFDSIGVPSSAEMNRDWGSGERWQEAMTRRWIQRLAANAERCEVAILEGQTRPSFIEPHLARAGIRHARILLLDCTRAVRLERLRDLRAQPELASERMDAWAGYLRGQADALGLRVLDTSTISVQKAADALAEELVALRAAAGTATWERERWSIAPYFIVDDVVSTANYYRDTLGFHYERFWNEPPSFCMVKRDGIVIMLAQLEASGVMRPNRIVDPEGGAWDSYIWVDDADALYAEFKKQGVRISRDICNQPYGCRDFDIEDCNGYRLCFGQDLEG